MYYLHLALSAVFLVILNVDLSLAGTPIVVNTWPFTNATAKAWKILDENGSALDAVVAGCTECEVEQCDGTVGYGGSPDENGETTLDALIMDGTTHDVGAVGGLRRVKNAIRVARAVMEYTTHTLLIGDLAKAFAIEMGFPETDLQTNKSVNQWKAWKNGNCQPNYRKDVTPDPKQNCGPYTPKPNKGQRSTQKRFSKDIGRFSHDTIGMVAVDSSGNIAGGTSTNGVRFKVPGRVGDSPIMGAGAYASGEVGAAAATGDGDVMMRFLPSYHAVLLMENGKGPTEAAQMAIAKIAQYYPSYTGAVVALNKLGEHGAACHNMRSFPYSVQDRSMQGVEVIRVPCTSG